MHVQIALAPVNFGLFGVGDEGALRCCLCEIEGRLKRRVIMLTLMRFSAGRFIVDALLLLGRQELIEERDLHLLHDMLKFHQCLLHDASTDLFVRRRLLQHHEHTLDLATVDNCGHAELQPVVDGHVCALCLHFHVHSFFHF